MAAIDMVGRRYGKLIVVSRADNARDGSARWFCRCDCGGTGTYAGTRIRAGRQRSCGCGMQETMFRSANGELHTHGMSASRVYRIWAGMRTRCSPSASGKSRRLYYERGIRVCARWHEFVNFLADMGEPPSGASIDRINPNGDYEPDNCRWASAAQQANNTRSNHVVEFNSRSLTVAEWAREIGVKQNTLEYRIQRGMKPEYALRKTVVSKRAEAMLCRTRPCEHCGALFIPRPAQLRAGQGRYCSHACSYAAAQKDVATGRIVRCA